MPLQSSDIFDSYSARFSENGIEWWTMETEEKEEASVTAGRIMPNLCQHPRPRDRRSKLLRAVDCGRRSERLLSYCDGSFTLTLQFLAAPYLERYPIHCQFRDLPVSLYVSIHSDITFHFRSIGLVTVKKTCCDDIITTLDQRHLAYNIEPKP
ncbi:uncharacterized protein ARMOST_11844 [Armillaria ostoyae]|uniref:Uncharacterized protein n=1 Tax=Armillaria ostoyae TaxID=47428 RepID=A0A284RI92_ARMOS|nr:uncharacterized protein ARMOST_11844 [Armillaria ostoyae]